MKRKERRALIGLVLFFVALFLILLPNFGHVSADAFAWSEIRYKPRSISTIEQHGRCPGLSESSKPALVVSRVAADGDATWLESLADKYHLCVYTVDAPRALDESSHYLRVPANRGREAMAYLTFLIDNYADIPAAGVVFVHGQRTAWHNDVTDYDNKAALMDLNTTAALEVNGFHNLRCDWGAGTCAESLLMGPKVLPQGSMETRMTAMLEPFNMRAVSDAAIPDAFAKLFGGAQNEEKYHVRLNQFEILRSQCCAQMVVARDKIQQHSQEEYVALRQWLLEPGGAPSNDKIAGRILSYIWHILWLPDLRHDSHWRFVDLPSLNSLACPTAEECYCRLYGRCSLQCLDPGHCEGQYSLPKNYKVPSN